MNLLIIEDEAAAARRLQHMIGELAPDAQILDVLDTVEASVEWLRTYPEPDLLLMDIYLADGSSFEIFQEVVVRAPVIFTTAYNEYALQAFKVNSIDYLLKPLKKEELDAALQKYRDLQSPQRPAYDQLLDLLPRARGGYPKRIVIRYGQHLKALEIKEAAYFYIESRVVLMRTFDGKEYPVDQNLDQLEAMLDPQEFFRINRKYIVQVKAIDQMYAYSKSRIRLILQPGNPDDAIVSTERAARFKTWLRG
ncbi:MAG: LytTR family DNA-binding domain-containing protein [Bacteroidia bacterium]